MDKWRFGLAAFAAAAATGAGCSVNVSGGRSSGGTPSTTLVAATGRTIPDGQRLGFQFEPEAGRLVTVSVQASTDLANPDFFVLRGAFDRLEDASFDDAVLLSADEGSGEEIDSFTPETKEIYTLFVEDKNSWAGATFSVTVTQR